MEKMSFKLEVFEGPLDLLLYLISKNKLNIYDINISELLDQYLEYIRQVQRFDMELAGEFLEMAARLVYIKTAMLLPRHEEQDDPRKELTGELIEYQTCKQIAVELGKMADGWDYGVREPMQLEAEEGYHYQHQVRLLYEALTKLDRKAFLQSHPPMEDFSPIVAKKIVSVGSKVLFILKIMVKNNSMPFYSLFHTSRSRSETVATFLALLELVRGKRITVEDGGELTVRFNPAAKAAKVRESVGN